MLDHIREALEVMRANEIAEFELQRENLKLRLRKNAQRRAEPPASAPAAPLPFPLNGASVRRKDDGLHLVKSPLVGIFHRARQRGATPFVNVGQAVTKGQVLAIIEAIRLTHEIKAGCDGTIVNVSPPDGQAVQYGDDLFEIAPARS
jgi:acetyl-CoA carboxylase biotin carboxyl carrier protein